MYLSLATVCLAIWKPLQTFCHLYELPKKNFFKNIWIELACLQMQTCELVKMHNCILADFEVCKTCATNADLLSEYHDTYSYATGIIDGLPEH